jgi:hypothetical protein
MRYIDIDGSELEVEMSPSTYLYYKNNVLHRLDGAAYIGYDGIKHWYYEGKHINCSSQEEFSRILKLKLYW